MERLGRGSSQHEGPEKTSLAWSRSMVGKAGLSRVESTREMVGQREEGVGFVMAFSAKVRVFNIILKFKGKGRPSEGFK